MGSKIINVNNERGFTLMEMLLVLFILSVLLMISTSILLKDQAAPIYQSFEQEMELISLEGYSLARGYKPTHLKCENDALVLKDVQTMETLRELTYPKKLALRCLLKDDRFEFGAYEGSINAGSIYLMNDTNDILVKYTVNITYGRLKRYE